ncbi:OmpP1/FadL family transporter [Rhodophyticola sp.]|jgi:long-subunit fatty acid transport protein|uniref:OmpP1/FadL family transporter n=1 Tax=Rhodophyticola sp. TaxID=2680032 RepID=UPI003D2B86B3
MKNIVAASAALLASTAIASADISRTDQSMRVLFEDVGPSGNYVELSFGRVQPEANTPTLPNPLRDYTLPGFAFLHRMNDQLSFAVIYDNPFGAAVGYPGFATAAPAGLPFFGGNANVETEALTVTGRYEFGNGFSVHAGLRALESTGTIYTGVNPPAFSELNASSSEPGLGYLVGAAYEIPDIALRVALTYHSAIDVSFTGTEATVDPQTGVASATVDTAFEVEFPESINLEFQSGIAEDTLLFGSIRHAFWDGFNVTTPGATGGRYVNFTSDSTTYTIGVGRRFNENWSGSIAYTHRTSGATPSDTALSPTTGLDSITLAGQYEQDAFTVSGGITYGMPGDQVVNSLAGPLNFEDNRVLGIGLRVGFRF